MNRRGILHKPVGLPARPAPAPSTRAKRVQRSRVTKTGEASRSGAPASKSPSPPRRPAPGNSPSLTEPDKVRVSKLMSERGMCSRREADDYIERGWVYVDGVKVEQLGARIDPSQNITLDKRVDSLSRVTILLHKPVGYVSAQAENGYRPAVTLITPAARFNGDTHSRRFARDHLKGLAPAGRLDINSTGLLVLTQDGRTAKLLIGEHSPIEKEYLVRVEGRLDDRGLRLLNHGMSLDGVALKPAQVAWLNRDQLRFVLREGKKRQIRRMCERVGLRVTGLRRVRIGRVTLGDLPLGQWRYLRDGEQF